MKYIAVIVVLAYFVTILAPSQSVTVCPVVCNIKNTTNVCGKIGTICIRFSNACNFNLSKCTTNKYMTKVALSRCRGITAGSSGTCKASTTTNSGVVTIANANALGGYYGGLYPSTSSVTPIIIRV